MGEGITTAASQTRDEQGEAAFDLFVSYAHADDEVPSGAQRGWVTTLVGELKKVLRRKLGGEGASVWMDHALTANQWVTPTLAARVERSRTLLLVLSPGYGMSDWCQRELAGFVAAAVARGEGDSIFLIEIEPVARNTLPGPLRDLAPLRFWEPDADRDEPRLSGYPAPNADEHSLYWKMVSRLAHQIAQRLKASRSPPPLPAGHRAAPLAPSPALALLAGLLPQAQLPEADGIALYLHAAPEDQAAATEIATQLDATGVTVLQPRPAPGQSFHDCLLQNEALLRQCHGMLMVNGQSPAGNLLSAWQLARRVFGVRRAGPWSAALHLPPPGRPDLPIHNLVQIDCRDGFDITRLAGFFSALRAAAPGGAGAGHV